MMTCKPPSVMRSSLCRTVLLAFAAHVALWPIRAHAAEPGLVPRKSDVVFSPRFLRPESPQAAEAWGATRIEWVYTQTPAAKATLDRLPPGVGQTLNANPSLPEGKGFALDFDGEPIVVPWLKSSNIKWVTTTHPETKKALADELERVLASHPHSIQVDDPLLQYFSATNQGGDFNPATQTGFRDWLRLKADPTQVRAAGLTGFDGNYREFLAQNYNVRDAADYRQRFRSFASTPLWLEYIRSTVEEYIRGVRQQVHLARPTPVSLSMNLAGLTWPDARQSHFFLTEFIDYVLAETQVTNTDELIARAATARSLGVGLVPSIRPVDVARNRVSIATLYALGTQPVVPWDVFVPDQPRYFGKVAEYGDLYAFVRRNAALFDGFDTRATVGIVVDPKAFPITAVKDLVQRLGERQIQYDFILVGSDGRYQAQLDRTRIGALQLLLMGVSDSQLDATQRAVLLGSGVPRAPLDRVSTSQLDALRPVVVAPSSGTVRVYIRTNASKPSNWVAHVIDESRGGLAPGDAPDKCERRIGFLTTGKEGQLPDSVTWITSSARVKLAADKSGGGRYFNLPGCPVWGILSPDTP